MDGERVWKWAERAAVVVIGPLCAVVGTYFAAGTYFGWDKQAAEPHAKDHAGAAMMALPSWLGFALLGVAILSLLTGWTMILLRRQADKAGRQRPSDQTAVQSANRDRSTDVQSAVPPESRIYVTQMGIDTNKLQATPPKLEMYLLAVNATGQTINVVSASGSISFRENPPGDEAATLAPPLLAADRTSLTNIGDNTELMVIVEFSVPRWVAENFQKALAADKQVHVGLHHLDIMATVGTGSKETRLRIWSGIAIHKTKDHVWTGRIVEMSAHIKL
jgi:hypothetical protein